jgi:enoyl-CoA hydratase/carnithine racemase
MEQPVIFTRRGGTGEILLNRPQALNALTLDMCHALERQLRDWAADDALRAVVIQGAGGKAFSAGGDIRRLAESARAGDDYPYRFWADEYRLNALIKHYPKPYVALIDGIVMGGGVGLSAHGRFRVVTERAVFAMPETGIGFFPDVGGSFLLSRCPGETGLYLGLTGARLKAADMIYAGIATHHVPQGRLAAVHDALSAEPAHVPDVLARFAEDPGPAPLAVERAAIDRLFAGGSLTGLLAALAADEGEFARQTARTLAAKSPTSLALTFREIREGARLSFDDCLRLEWRIASRVPRHLPDFREGVRALIVDKDNKPRWSPARVEEVDQATIDAFFAPTPLGELQLGGEPRSE